jgi:prophage maintenance system killer protein
MESSTMDNNLEIYQSEDGALQLSVSIEQDTVWLSQAQMAELFGTKRPAITKHLGNIYQSGELDELSTCSILEHMANHGQRYKTKLYNLDAIISLGYRINSGRATQFRMWATKTLKQHLLQGYTINQQRFEKNAVALEQALKLIQKTAQSPELSLESGRGLVDIVSRYTQTFLWLQRYDEGLLDEPEGQTGGTLPSPDVAMQSLLSLKQQLIARGEATDMFARPRDVGLAGIFGNLDQSVFGEPAYPTVESKAAHLLYFVVKNHPFTDGNKRSGAFLFVDFLHRNGRLLNKNDQPVINDTGLAALTLLVAESDPKQKETLIRLIMTMLANGSDAK